MEPAWKRLGDDLKAQGHRSEYLDRLQERLPTRLSNTFDLARELLQEMAISLGRSEDKINLALLQLELCERDIANHASTTPHDVTWRVEMNARISAYNAQRDKARQMLWELTVHREAMGLRCEHDFTEYYPIPAAKPLL